MKNLKKFGIISLTALSVLAVSACGNDDNNNPNAKSGDVNESSVAQASGSSVDASQASGSSADPSQASGSSAAASSQTYQIEELDNIEEILDAYLSDVFTVETTHKDEDGRVNTQNKVQAKFDKETGDFAYYNKSKNKGYSSYTPDGATQPVSYLYYDDCEYSYYENGAGFNYDQYKYLKTNGDVNYFYDNYGYNKIPASVFGLVKSVLSYDFSKLNSILNSTANLLIGENGLVSKAYSYVTTILSKYLKPVNEAQVKGLQYKLDTASLKADLTALNGKAVTDYITAFLGEDALTDLLSTLKTFLTQDDIFELFTIAKNVITTANVELPEQAKMAVNVISSINTKEDLSNLLDSVPSLLTLVKPTIKADILAMIEAIDFTITVDENLYTINFEIPQFASLQATVENKENEFNVTANLVAPMMGSYDVTFSNKNVNGVINGELDINMTPANVLTAETDGVAEETVKNNINYKYSVDTVNKTVLAEEKTPTSNTIIVIDNSIENEIKGLVYSKNTQTSNYGYKNPETGETVTYEVSDTYINEIDFDLAKTENGYIVSVEKSSNNNDKKLKAVAADFTPRLAADDEEKLNIDFSVDMLITKEEINVEYTDDDNETTLIKITHSNEFDSEFVKEVKDAAVNPVDKLDSINLNQYTLTSENVTINADYSIVINRGTYLYDWDNYGYVYDLSNKKITDLYEVEFYNGELDEIAYNLGTSNKFWSGFYLDNKKVYVVVDIKNGELDFSTIKFYSDNKLTTEIEKPADFNSDYNEYITNYYSDIKRSNPHYWISFDKKSEN